MEVTATDRYTVRDAAFASVPTSKAAGGTNFADMLFSAEKRMDQPRIEDRDRRDTPSRADEPRRDEPRTDEPHRTEDPQIADHQDTADAHPGSDDEVPHTPQNDDEPPVDDTVADAAPAESETDGQTRETVDAAGTEGETEQTDIAAVEGEAPTEQTVEVAAQETADPAQAVDPLIAAAAAQQQNTPQADAKPTETAVDPLAAVKAQNTSQAGQPVAQTQQAQQQTPGQAQAQTINPAEAARLAAETAGDPVPAMKTDPLTATKPTAPVNAVAQANAQSVQAMQNGQNNGAGQNQSGQNGNNGQNGSEAAQAGRGNQPNAQNPLAQPGAAPNPLDFRAALNNPTAQAGTAATATVAVDGAPTGSSGLAATPGTGPQAQASQQAQHTTANHQARQGTTAQLIQDQVAVHIKNAAKDGMDHIKISLNPARLGRVDVQMEITGDGRLMAVIQADNKETYDLLRQDSRALEKAMQDAGFDTDSGSFTFEHREGNEADDGRRFGGSGPADAEDTTQNGPDEGTVLSGAELAEHVGLGYGLNALGNIDIRI